MDRESSFGVMEPTMKVNLLMVYFMDRVNMYTLPDGVVKALIIKDL